MSEFWILFRESVIVQSLITLILVLGIVYMFVTGMPVPDQLLDILYLVLGFWFGAKTQKMIAGDRKVNNG